MGDVDYWSAMAFLNCWTESFLNYIPHGKRFNSFNKGLACVCVCTYVHTHINMLLILITHINSNVCAKSQNWNVLHYRHKNSKYNDPPLQNCSCLALRVKLALLQVAWKHP